MDAKGARALAERLRLVGRDDTGYGDATDRILALRRSKMTRVRLPDEKMSDELSPDHSTCEFCGRPISWDEICYTHDDSGFAECGVLIEDGELVGERFIVNPALRRGPEFTGKNAEPVTWYTDA